MSETSFAKTVELKWSKVAGAEKYLLEVFKNGKSIISKKVNDTRYLTDLDPGLYSYRMRGEDKFGREGRWSQPKDLIITATPPRVELSIIPEKINYAGLFPVLPIHWKKSDFADSYQIEIKNTKTGEVVLKKETQATELKIENLPNGEFEYRVASLIELRGKKYSSKGVKGRALIVTKEKLEAPTNLQPETNVILSDEAVATIEWNPVKGAESYEVTFEPLSPREIATSDPKKTWIVTKTQMEIPVEAQKKYRWNVRALAGATDSSDSATSTFQTEIDHTVEEKTGSIQLGASSSQTFGSLSGPSSGGGVSAQGLGLGFSARADFWFSKKIGVEAFFERNSFSSLNGTYGMNLGAIMVKTRWKFRNSPEAWEFYSKAGIGLSDYLMISSTTQNSANVTSLGLALDFGAEKPLSDDFNFQLGMFYFVPTQLTNGANLVQFWNNLSATGYTKLNHRLNQNLIASLGVRYDLRTLNSGGSTNPDKFNTSGLGVDFSFKYKFGEVNPIKISDLLGSGFRKLANINESDQGPLKSNHGVLEVVSGSMPFNSSTTQNSFTSSGSGVSFRNGIRGEYWPWQLGGFAVDYSQSYYQVGTSEKLGQDIAINYSRRFYLDGVFGGSILIAKIGAASKSWIKLYSNNTAEIVTQPGPTFDLEFRKLFGKTMLSIAGQYQYPQIYTGKLKVFHPIYGNLEFGAEGFYENQITKTYTDSFTQKQNVGLLGVLRYRFGVTY